MSCMQVNRRCKHHQHPQIVQLMIFSLQPQSLLFQQQLRSGWWIPKAQAKGKCGLKSVLPTGNTMSLLLKCSYARVESTLDTDSPTSPLSFPLLLLLPYHLQDSQGFALLFIDWPKATKRKFNQMYHTYSLGSFNTNYIFRNVKILQSINQSINYFPKIKILWMKILYP